MFWLLIIFTITVKPLQTSSNQISINANAPDIEKFSVSVNVVDAIPEFIWDKINFSKGIIPKYYIEKSSNGFYWGSKRCNVTQEWNRSKCSLEDNGLFCGLFRIAVDMLTQKGQVCEQNTCKRVYSKIIPEDTTKPFCPDNNSSFSAPILSTEVEGQTIAVSAQLRNVQVLCSYSPILFYIILAESSEINKTILNTKNIVASRNPNMTYGKKVCDEEKLYHVNEKFDNLHPGKKYAVIAYYLVEKMHLYLDEIEFRTESERAYVLILVPSDNLAIILTVSLVSLVVVVATLSILIQKGVIQWRKCAEDSQTLPPELEPVRVYLEDQNTRLPEFDEKTSVSSEYEKVDLLSASSKNLHESSAAPLQRAPAKDRCSLASLHELKAEDIILPTSPENLFGNSSITDGEIDSVTEEPHMRSVDTENSSRPIDYVRVTDYLPK